MATLVCWAVAFDGLRVVRAAEWMRRYTNNLGRDAMVARIDHAGNIGKICIIGLTAMIESKEGAQPQL
jgi:hypothetical protein